MSENGKGDKRRPKSVDYKTWDQNYERIFRDGTGKRKKKSNGVSESKQ